VCLARSKHGLAIFKSKNGDKDLDNNKRVLGSTLHVTHTLLLTVTNKQDQRLTIIYLGIQY
jgi:hypothetical protein